MARDLEIVTAPEEGAHLNILSIEEFRRHALLTSTKRDLEFDENIRDAVDYLASALRRTILPTTLRAYFPTFPDGSVIELHRPPLVSVTSVKYLDTSSVEQPLSNSNYIVRTNTLVGNVELLPTYSWPSIADHPRAVRVLYVAGYDGTVHQIPHALKRATFFLAHHYSKVKEPTTAESRVTLLSKKQEFALADILGTLSVPLPYGEEL